MNAWLLALMSSSPQLVTRTFTSNQSFTVPLGVSNLETISGQGAAGSIVQNTVSRSATAAVVVYYHNVSGGFSPGALTWDFFDDAVNIANSINTGGSGSAAGPGYTGYGGDNTYRLSPDYTVTWSNAVAGSASPSYSAGWQMSGPIGSPTDDASGSASVNWTEYTGTTTTITGASATGFGKTFPGGAGGAASVTSFTNVAVTGGASYSIVVPTGGSITITYYQ